MTDNNVLSLTIVPNSQSTMYVGAATSLYKTTNGGTSWTEVTTGLGRMPLSSVAASPTKAWTVSEVFAYASKYDGTQWVRVSLGSGSFVGKNIRYDLGGGADTLYAAGAVNTVAALYNSTDGGSTYANQFPLLTTTNTRFIGTVIDPINYNRVYVFGAYTDGSQRNWDYSNTGGFSWTHTRPLISGTYTTVQDMVVDASSQFSGISQNILAAMNNNGIYRSTNGEAGPWSQVFLNPATDVKSLALNTSAPSYVYAAAATGVWRSTSNGSSGTWVNMRGGAYKKVTMSPGVGSDNRYIAAILDDGSKVYYSPDAGSQWFDVTGNLPTPINNLFGVDSTTGIGRMYVATDKGTFKIAEPAAAPSSPTVANGTKFDVALSWGSVSNTTAYHLQVSYNSSFTNLVSDINLTGTSYSPTSLINSTQYYWRVAANNIAGETDFATGTSFTLNASELDQATVNFAITTDANHHPVLSWNAFNTGSSGQYKICRYSCVYPGGDCNPHPESTPYPVIYTTSLLSYTDGNVIVAGKLDNPNTEYFYEIRRADYSVKKSVKSEEQQKTGIQPGIAEGQIPRETRLKSNFPNPFNPVTEIKYDLAEDAQVTLKVYDVLGQEMATLVDGFESAGYKTIQFNASTLPSGIYFYRLQAGKFSDIKKMLLMK